MELLKRIIHIIAIISYLAISIYVLLVIPKLFGNNPVVVLSNSMSPTYPVGTIVYYHKTNKKDIKENDVITFKTTNNKFVTHRVNKLVNDKFETKGDANNSPDAKLVDYKNVVGKVTPISIPYLGYYVEFINTNFYLVIGVVLILVLEFVLANFNINRKEEVKKDEKSKK